MPRETDSGESEKTGCNIISTDTAAEAMDLELNPFIQLGQVIEVTGKTQKGAPHDGKRQRDAGGEFRWAVPLSRAPLPPGKAVITVTAQTAPVG